MRLLISEAEGEVEERSAIVTISQGREALIPCKKR